MLAIDTNIVVRYLTGDHLKQSSRAQKLIDGHDVYVSKTVMLEAEWVLRGVYGFTAAEICNGLRAFAGHPRVNVESPALVSRALDLAELGLDFADALHFASTADCEAMLTFDRTFIKNGPKGRSGDAPGAICYHSLSHRP